MKLDESSVKLGQHGSLGCARRWGTCIRQMPPLPALVHHHSESAQQQSSKRATWFHHLPPCSNPPPPARATDRRLTFTHLFGDSIPNAVFITRCLSRGGAVRLFSCSSCPRRRLQGLLSSQLLSSTHLGRQSQNCFLFHLTVNCLCAYLR